MRPRQEEYLRLEAVRGYRGRISFFFKEQKQNRVYENDGKYSHGLTYRQKYIYIYLLKTTKRP